MNGFIFFLFAVGLYFLLSRYFMLIGRMDRIEDKIRKIKAEQSIGMSELKASERKKHEPTSGASV